MKLGHCSAARPTTLGHFDSRRLPLALDCPPCPVLSRALLLAVLMVAGCAERARESSDAGIDQTQAGTCTFGQCNGCCLSGACISWSRQTETSCGTGGQSCVYCPAGVSCVEGLCGTDAVCGPGTCAAGCCAAGLCLEPGQQNEQSCGTGGGLCQACAAGQSCENGACGAGPCTNQCTVGETQCATSAAAVQTCEMGPSGCTMWRTTKTCGPTEVCQDAACTACVHCALGSGRCMSKTVQTCVAGTEECNKWQVSKTCGTDELCVLGVCVGGGCADCTVGETKCEGYLIMTCQTDSPSCTNWHPTTDCSLQGKNCVGDVCGGTLPCDNCPAGITGCSGNSLETCTEVRTNCTRWQVGESCGLKRCMAGICM